MTRQRRAREARHYDPYRYPPRWHWTIPAPCPRDTVHAFLDALETVITERFGARFYFANPKDGATRCRFEWHLRSRDVRDLLRLGCELTVSATSVSDVTCYASTNVLVAQPWRALPEVPDRVFSALQREVTAVLDRAVALLDPVNHRLFHVVCHVATGGGAGFGEAMTLEPAMRILPTVALLGSNARHGRVSAVVVSGRGAGREHARHEAKRSLATISALATLATSLLFKPLTLDWPKNARRREFLDAHEPGPTRGIYPRHAKLGPSGETPKDLPLVLGELWRARRALTEDARDTFDQALLAYFGAMEIRFQQPTISVVATVAALNMLAAPLGEECEHPLVCPTHGALGFKHRLRGDAAAITLLACDLLGLRGDSDDGRSVKKLVRRVYNEQRSAYVHGAELRHGEYGAAREPHASIRPAATGQYTKLAQYETDANSIVELCRRVLIAWLSRTSGVAIDVRGFDRGSTILRARTEEGAFSFGAGVQSVMRILPWRPGELEAAEAAADAREQATLPKPERSTGNGTD